MNKFFLYKIVLSVLLFFTALDFSAQQWEGLTLIAPKNSNIGRLVDTNSVVVKTWTFTGGTNSYPAYMSQGGFVYRTVTTTSSVTPQNGGMTGKIQKIDYNGNILWDYTYNTPQGVLHHDITLMPNGHILATAYDVKSASDMTLAGCTYTGSSTMWSEKIMELEPVGTNSANIVWEWKMWDHLCQNTNSLAANYVTSIVNNPQLWNINYQPARDFFHMNGLDYNPVLDQITFSSHMRNELYIIDHSPSTAVAATHTGGNAGKGGDILYRWGNPAAYQATGPLIGNAYFHDGHFIPEGCPEAGYIVGFNNLGQMSPSFRSTIDHVKATRVGYNYTITPGSAFTPTSYSSRYVCTAYASGYSSSEQFPNGNQMICLASSGTIYEVNSLGTLLWSFNAGGLTPQAHRYSQCFVDFPAPPQPSISVSGSSLICTNAVTYKWYFNGDSITGANSQTLYCPFGQNGNYVVRITDVNGCAFYYSQNMFFSPPAPPPPPTGLVDLTIELNKIQVYPNPSNGEININLNSVSEKYSVELRSSTGQLILTENNKSKINLSEMSNGIYFIKIITDKGSVAKKITLLR